MLGFVANMAMTPSLGKVNYDAINGFAPISMVAQGYQILSVNPAFAAKSVAELIALAKDKPNALNDGSGGSGTPLHLVGELFKMRTGTDIQHVPYKGSPQATSVVLAGETQMLFGSVVSTLPFVQSGRLRAGRVAKSTAARWMRFASMDTSKGFASGTSAWTNFLRPMCWAVLKFSGSGLNRLPAG